MASTFHQEFITQALFRMHEHTPRIKKCLDELSEDEIWYSPNLSSNSVANLIFHLCGNITQYIISALGQNTDLSVRDLEFKVTNGYHKTELMEKLSIVVLEASNIISKLSSKDLMNVTSVQGFELSGTGIIMHVVEHFSYHTGQIVFWTKALKNKDLSFYANYNL